MLSGVGGGRLSSLRGGAFQPPIEKRGVGQAAQGRRDGWYGGSEFA